MNKTELLKSLTPTQKRSAQDRVSPAYGGNELTLEVRVSHIIQLAGSTWERAHPGLPAPKATVWGGPVEADPHCTWDSLSPWIISDWYYEEATGSVHGLLGRV